MLIRADRRGILYGPLEGREAAATLAGSIFKSYGKAPRVALTLLAFRICCDVPFLNNCRISNCEI